MFYQYFIYLGYSPFFRCVVGGYYLPVWGCHFILVIIFLKCRSILIWCRPIVYLCFHLLTKGIIEVLLRMPLNSISWSTKYIFFNIIYGFRPYIKVFNPFLFCFFCTKTVIFWILLFVFMFLFLLFASDWIFPVPFVKEMFSSTIYFLLLCWELTSHVLETLSLDSPFCPTDLWACHYFSITLFGFLQLYRVI